MSIDFATTAGLLLGLLPELILTAWALVLLVVVGVRHKTVGDLRLAAGIAGVALLTTFAAVVWLWWNRATGVGLASMIAADDYRWVTEAVVLLAAGLSVMLSQEYLEREGLLAPEFYLLLVFATLGMMLMAGGADLMVIFLGLETMSVGVYVLAAFDRRSPRAAEAGIKYFLLGAFASGFLLYGIALLYGATGTTNLALIGTQVQLFGLGSHPMLLLGLALLLVGFAFKVAAVPFHAWAPDVYDGAPTPVTAFMATAVKIAAFTALVRIVVTALPGVTVAPEILTGLAIATMVVGNVVALSQRTLKRMLAWSSVAHAGYLLAAVAAGGEAGTAAFLTYVIAYALTALAAFGVLAWLGRGGEGDVQIDDLAGLAATRPWTAFALAVCMLSLLGFPGTAGFIGKWYILLAAVQAGLWPLAVVLVVTSVVSAGYYLPVIMASYMKPARSPAAHAGVRVASLASVAVGVTVAAVLVFGVWPNRLVGLARETGKGLRPGAGFAPAAAVSAPPTAPSSR